MIRTLQPWPRCQLTNRNCNKIENSFWYKVLKAIWFLAHSFASYCFVLEISELRFIATINISESMEYKVVNNNLLIHRNSNNIILPFNNIVNFLVINIGKMHENDWHKSSSWNINIMKWIIQGEFRSQVLEMTYGPTIWFLWRWGVVGRFFRKKNIQDIGKYYHMTAMPGQIVQTQIRSSLIRVYTVCHSVCMVWTHYSMVEPHSSNLEWLRQIVWVSEYLGNLR